MRQRYRNSSCSGTGRSASREWQTTQRRLADLQDRIQAGQNRLLEIADALAAAGPEVTSETVQAALGAFDGAWDAMPVADQCRLLSLLIEKVTYDGETVALTYRPNGFTDAINEQATDD